jgi:hypothetical protein
LTERIITPRNNGAIRQERQRVEIAGGNGHNI